MATRYDNAHAASAARTPTTCWQLEDNPGVCACNEFTQMLGRGDLVETASGGYFPHLRSGPSTFSPDAHKVPVHQSLSHWTNAAMNQDDDPLWVLTPMPPSPPQVTFTPQNPYSGSQFSPIRTPQRARGGMEPEAGRASSHFDDENPGRRSDNTGIGYKRLTRTVKPRARSSVHSAASPGHAAPDSGYKRLTSPASSIIRYPSHSATPPVHAAPDPVPVYAPVSPRAVSPISPVYAPASPRIVSNSPDEFRGFSPAYYRMRSPAPGPTDIISPVKDENAAFEDLHMEEREHGQDGSSQHGGSSRTTRSSHTYDPVRDIFVPNAGYNFSRLVSDSPDTGGVRLPPSYGDDHGANETLDEEDFDDGETLGDGEDDFTDEEDEDAEDVEDMEDIENEVKDEDEDQEIDDEAEDDDAEDERAESEDEDEDAADESEDGDDEMEYRFGRDEIDEEEEDSYTAELVKRSSSTSSSLSTLYGGDPRFPAMPRRVVVREDPHSGDLARQVDDELQSTLAATDAVMHATDGIFDLLASAQDHIGDTRDGQPRPAPVALAAVAEAKKATEEGIEQVEAKLAELKRKSRRWNELAVQALGNVADELGMVPDNSQVTIVRKRRRGSDDGDDEEAGQGEGNVQRRPKKACIRVRLGAARKY